MSRRRPVAVLVALVAAGCGGSSVHGSSSADSADAGARTAMAKWAAARTLADRCDLLSSGFRFFIGNGDPSRTACIAHGRQVIGAPVTGRLVIHSVRSDHGQTLVDASVAGQRTTYYLIPEYNEWRINSIGIREGLGPSPPPLSDMNK